MKIVLLDLDTAPGGERLATALRDGPGCVDLVTDPAAAAWLCGDDAVSVVVVRVRRVDAATMRWLHCLRAAGARTPALVVADVLDPTDVVAVLDAGADDAVSRPLRLGEVTARARALARRAPVHHPPSLGVGDLVLDPAAHRVTRAGRDVDLTPRQFAILHELMRQAGRAVTRPRLLEVAWERTHDPASNIVDQHVAALRDRVDRPFGRADIETVRGVGYRVRRP